MTQVALTTEAPATSRAGSDGTQASRTHALFRMLILLTILDAVASFYSIVTLRFTYEGNGALASVTESIESLGLSFGAAFGITMLLRTAFGVGLIFFLMYLFRTTKLQRTKTMISRTFFGLVVVFALLASYHLFAIGTAHYYRL